MRLPERITEWLLGRIPNRPPDFIIGGEDNPYLYRWYVIPRNRWLNIYVHKFLRSDDDRALHDHPWASVSVVLQGYMGEAYYRDVTDRVTGTPRHRIIDTGEVIYRRASFAHRLIVPTIEYLPNPITLFVTGPKTREWGFWCPQGWRHWREFCAVDEHNKNSGRVGKGCE